LQYVANAYAMHMQVRGRTTRPELSNYHGYPLVINFIGPLATNRWI